MFEHFGEQGFFLLVGLLTGLLSGLLGIGGGLVVVPALTLCGVSLHQAVSLSLLYILITGSTGVWMHIHQRQVHGRLALLLALGGILGAIPGVWISLALPTAWLAWLFGLLLVGVIVLHVRKMWNFNQMDLFEHRSNVLVAALIGGLAGLLSGIFGVGGGFVMTPLLNLCLPLTLKESIGTSLTAIVLIALAGLVTHLLQGEQILGANLMLIVLLGLGGMLGAPLGAHLTRQIPTSRLQQILLVFLGLVAFYMFFLGLTNLLNG